MTVPTLPLSLLIDAPTVTPSSANYRLPSWPPPRDFPIVLDDNGNVVSRFHDSVWRLWPWAAKALTLNFGDGPLRKGAAPISAINADLLRQVMAWLLYGPRAVREATTLKSQFKYLRPIFAFCTSEGISASDLSRHRLVAEKLVTAIRPSRAGECIGLLHELFEQRENLGFVLLDRDGLRRLSSCISAHEKNQTPYIPPRIWTYQVRRLREFLDDFTERRDSVVACYEFCVDAYAKVAGSLARSFGRGLQPFSKRRGKDDYFGPFTDIAHRFGIDRLLEKWLLPSGQSLADCETGVRLLTRYLSMLGFVGTAYLVNFSLMRIDEAWRLRANCLECEDDDRFGPIYLLAGPTTKTVRDGDARWVTSPSVKVAVDAMSCIAKLRMITAAADPRSNVGPDDLANPYLAPRPFEPWCNSRGRDKPLSIRPNAQPYQGLMTMYPNLFDANELKITEEDLRIARLITPTLDPLKFAAGNIWPLAWHQIRRTGAVNMQASGLVSDSSLQYQLKHASRAMSLYYGRGYSRVRLDLAARNEYVKTMYETLGRQLATIGSSRWISPHGDKRKNQILELVSAVDAKKLEKAAKQGKVAWRPTLLGACTKLGPCAYGGIDNIIHCGGGNGRPACADALFDRNKAGQFRALKETLRDRLANAPEGSPYRDSLNAQLLALENAIHAISDQTRR